MLSDSTFDRRISAMRIIWCAILVSLAIYLFVGLLVGKNLQTIIDEDSYTVFKYVLYSLTCFTLIATWYLRKFLLARKIQSLQANQVSEYQILQKYFVASIVSWALSESIGIYGLILFFVGKNITDLYILILISAIAMFLYRPKKEDIISMAEQNQVVQAGNGPVA